MAKAIPLDDVTVMFSTFDALEKDPENRLSGMIVLDAAGTLVAEVGDRGHLAEAGELASLVDINGYAKSLVGASLYVATQVKSDQTAKFWEPW